MIGDREHERAVDIVSAFVARFVVKEAILIQEVSDRLDYNDVLEVFGRSIPAARNYRSPICCFPR